MVFRFETVEGCLWAIAVTSKSLVLLRCCDNKESGDTTNIVLQDGYGQFGWICL